MESIEADEEEDQMERIRRWRGGERWRGRVDGEEEKMERKSRWRG